AAALNALLANLAQVNALNDAMITSINRAQGAELDRQFGWVRRQARAAKTYALREADLLSAQPALRFHVRVAYEHAGVHVTYTASQAADAKGQIAREGFPALVQALFLRLGLSPATIRGLAAKLVRVPLTNFPVTFPNDLSDPAVTSDT